VDGQGVDDGPGGNAVGLEALGHRIGRPAARPPCDELVQLVVTGRSLVAGQPGQVGSAEPPGQRGPLGIGPDRDHHPGILTHERVIADAPIDPGIG